MITASVLGPLLALTVMGMAFAGWLSDRPERGACLAAPAPIIAAAVPRVLRVLPAAMQDVTAASLYGDWPTGALTRFVEAGEAA